MPSVTPDNPISQTPPVVPDTGGHKKQGLILAGGGAQGAYEAGVLRALLAGRSPATNYVPLYVDVLAGTSVGSINASLILSADGDGPAVADYLESTWLNDVAGGKGRPHSGAFRFRANPVTFFIPSSYSPSLLSPFVQFAQDAAFIAESFMDRVMNLFFGEQHLEERLAELIDLGVFVSSEPLHALLHKRIRLDKIRSSNKTLRIAATNWQRGKLHVFGIEDMTDHRGHQIILASSAIPGVYPDVEIDGERFVDGGVLMNTPLKPAIDAGANVLHIIYMQPSISHFPLAKFPNAVQSVYRSLVIGYGFAVAQDVETVRRVNKNVTEGRDHKSHVLITVHRYHPHTELGSGWLSFGYDAIHDMMDQGFRDAIEHDCVRNKCIVV